MEKEGNSWCEICYSEISDQESAIACKSCENDFHISCVTIATNLRNLCPMCKSPFYAKDLTIDFEKNDVTNYTSKRLRIKPKINNTSSSFEDNEQEKHPINKLFSHLKNKRTRNILIIIIVFSIILISKNLGLLDTILPIIGVFVLINMIFIGSDLREEMR